jgi:hypothetical protein
LDLVVAASVNDSTLEAVELKAILYVICLNGSFR